MRTGHVAWYLVCHIGDILGLPPNPNYVDWLEMAADYTPISAGTLVVVARSAKRLPKLDVALLFSIVSMHTGLSSHQPYFLLHHLTPLFIT